MEGLPSSTVYAHSTTLGEDTSCSQKLRHEGARGQKLHQQQKQEDGEHQLGWSRAGQQGAGCAGLQFCAVLFMFPKAWQICAAFSIHYLAWWVSTAVPGVYSVKLLDQAGAAKTLPWMAMALYCTSCSPRAATHQEALET